MIIMFALGLSRGQAWTTLFNTAVALAIAAIPLALPMVVQVVLSLGSVELAKQKAIVKDLPSVETLGFTSAINSDKTGTLTMNQVTVVEVLDATDRYTVSGTGYSLDGQVSTPPARLDTLDAAILPVRRRERRQARRRQGRRRPDRGRAARARAQGRARHRRHARAVAAPGDAALRPDLQAHGHLLPGEGRLGEGRRALLRQGRGAGRDEPARRRRDRTARASPGTTTSSSGPRSTSSAWERRACG